MPLSGTTRPLVMRYPDGVKCLKCRGTWMTLNLMFLVTSHNQHKHLTQQWDYLPFPLVWKKRIKVWTHFLASCVVPCTNSLEASSLFSWSARLPLSSVKERHSISIQYLHDTSKIKNKFQFENDRKRNGALLSWQSLDVEKYFKER